MFVAAIPVSVAVLSRRLLGVDLFPGNAAWIGLAVLGLVFLVLWLRRIPSRMQTALLVDRQLALHERFSTTLALAASNDPFACAARDEALQTAESLVVAKAFPIRSSRWWLYAVAGWVVVGLLGWAVPQKDLLGLLKKKQQQQQQAHRVETARKDVEKATDTVKLAMERLNIPDTNQDLAGLTSNLPLGRPEDIKRQAIRQLGSLSDKVKAVQSSLQGRAMEQLQQMLQQLRPSGQALTQQIELAMAKGEFGKAASLLKQLQQDMLEDKLGDQQKQELSKPLQDLARQLQRLAQQQKGLEQQLQDMGLDKNLAKLDTRRLREALHQQGLSSDKLEDLMQKATAAQQAAGRATALGQALSGGASGLSADDLAQAAQQLDELEGLQQQIRLSEATLAEIDRAIACLGEGMCQGDGGQGPFAEGDSRRSGSGSGGPGQGFGPRDSDTEGSTGTKKTQVKAETRQGPVVASWYFKGTQAKGETHRPFQEVLAASRDSAAEAIQDNQIPTKYQEAVKRYFGTLEQTGESSPSSQ
jgi:regulator of replication initiation timing